jgi:hypothetical protein
VYDLGWRLMRHRYLPVIHVSCTTHVIRLSIQERSRTVGMNFITVEGRIVIESQKTNTLVSKVKPSQHQAAISGRRVTVKSLLHLLFSFYVPKLFRSQSVFIVPRAIRVVIIISKVVHTDKLIVTNHNKRYIYRIIYKKI